MKIVDEAVQLISRLSRRELAGVGIERMVVGLYFTLVQLTSGACGLAMTEAERELASLAERPRQTGEHAPGRLAGLSLLDILSIQEEWPIQASIKWAVLNACSSHMERMSPRSVVRDRDILDWIDCSRGRRVTLVGAFQSHLDRLTACPCEVRVLELRPEMIPTRYRHLHVPSQDEAAVVAASDALIITGSTLVNSTLDDLLCRVGPKAQLALIGPSAGLFPDLLFDHGISLIGTTRITDPDRAFKIICEGGSGYHLFADCAEKIVMVHESAD